MIRALLKLFIARCGLQVRRRRFYYVDPFDDQRRLLADAAPFTIFDVGAHLGRTVRIYRRLFPTACIHAFEPTPATFERLSRDLPDDVNLRFHQLAVSDQAGSAKFRLHNHPDLNSLLPSHAEMPRFLEWSRDTGTVEVATTTLDEFTSSQAIDHVQILKLDIQGAELHALHGARQLLGRQQVDLIFCEVNFGQLYEGQAMFHDIAGFLHGLDYRLYGLYELFRGRNGSLGWSDAIFISPTVYRSLPDTFWGRHRPPG